MIMRTVAITYLNGTIEIKTGIPILRIPHIHKILIGALDLLKGLKGSIMKRFSLHFIVASWGIIFTIVVEEYEILVL